MARPVYSPEVPILRPADMAQGTRAATLAYADLARPTCLIGWVRRVFGECAPAGVFSAIRRAAGLRGRLVGDIALFNDAEERTLTELARVWNRAMAFLGYEDVGFEDGSEPWRTRRAA